MGNSTLRSRDWGYHGDDSGRLLWLMSRLRKVKVPALIGIINRRIEDVNIKIM